MRQYIFLGTLLLFQTISTVASQECNKMLQETISEYQRLSSASDLPEKVRMIERNLEELVCGWQTFFQSHDWRTLIAGKTGFNVGCGFVYELPNFLNYPNEDLAIIDMTGISISEPHYHPNMLEVYFMLEGSGCVYVAGEKHMLQQGDALVILPNKAHFTVPDAQCVLACVCMPPFHPDNYIPLKESNAAVGFDYEHFKSLSSKR